MQLIMKKKCRQNCWFEGYASEIKLYKDDKGGSVLEFTLVMTNTDENDETYLTFLPVVCYKQRAEKVGAFLKAMMLIEVQGYVRIKADQKVILVSSYVVDATPRLVKITIPEGK